MLKSNLIAAIQFEIRRHDWSTYMKDGIVRPGCSSCEVQINSTNQFVEHIAMAIPSLIDDLSQQGKKANEKERNRSASPKAYSA